MSSASIIESRITTTPVEYQWRRVNGKLIEVSSILNIGIQKAWDELQQTSLLRYISDGKTSFSELPEKWDLGVDIQTTVKTHLLKLIPMTTPHSIRFTNIDHYNHLASTHERNPTIKVWDHNMKMKEIDEDETLYTDQIFIYAGILSWIVAQQTKWLYEHRHKNWQRVVDILDRWESTSDEQHLISPLTI